MFHQKLRIGKEATGGEIVYKTPKTESSIRDVKIPDFIVASLREQQKWT